MEERHKAEMAQKAARDRISTLERAQQEAAHNIRQLTESLERQKQETYYLYTNYAQVASQLEDTKTALEREQEEIVRMHQGFAQQKMAIAGAASAGMGVGGLGFGMGGGVGGGVMGGGMGVRTQQQRMPQSLALPGAPGGGGGGTLMGGGGGVGKPPLYPGASIGGVGATGAGFKGGLPTPESLLPSFVGSSSPGFSVSPTSSTSDLNHITEFGPQE